MTLLTHDRVVEIAGPLSDTQIARILECEAREEDLLVALAWMSADDAIARATHHQPGSMIAQLCEVLISEEAAEDEEGRARGPDQPA